MKCTRPISYSLLSLVACGFMTFSSAPAMSANPYQPKYQDGDWITVTGDVNSVVGDSITLDFNGGLITVEMDDWDLFNESNLLKEGEKVTVYGRIDKGFYETKKVEADMVYAHNRSSFFYADNIDEEGDGRYYSHYNYPAIIPDGTWVSVSGKVKSVDGRELTMATGTHEIKVDTDEMSYNPLDEKGYQRVKQGDRIYVSGPLDVDFFEANEIKANSITSIFKDQVNIVGS